MKSHNMTSLLSKTAISLTLVLTSGCLTPEDKGTVETVGTPVGGEADFTVDQPPVGGGTGTGNGGIETEPTVPTNPATPQTPSVDFALKMNDGNAYFSGNTVTLSMIHLSWFHKMKVSQNANCEGGTWEDSATDKVVTGGFPQNAQVVYSVQFEDVDRVKSDCLTASAIHDDKGPDILFTKYPTGSVEEGAAGEILFDVRDPSPIKEVNCSLNQVSKPCLAGTNSVRLSAMPAGQYEFAVSAEDIHGRKSSQKVTWSVVNTIRNLTQTVLVKDDRKVDVLMVIDNSGSMQYEQQNMASRVRNLLSILRGLDYRIGVTTTDPSATRKSGSVTYYGDGDLIPIHNLNGQLWIDSTMSEETAQYNLGMTLQRKETGSGLEQGILATYRFVERATTPGTALSTFFRDGANFATILISDEDESANTTKNDPVKLLELIATKFNSQKAYSFHSIITRPGDTACRNTYGASYGERYKKITELTGGVLGSVCEADYAAQVSGIANQIRDLIKNITLTCEPLPQFPIIVKKDGTAFTGSHTIEGVNIKFADILEPGEYTVEYKCLKQ